MLEIEIIKIEIITVKLKPKDIKNGNSKTQKNIKNNLNYGMKNIKITGIGKSIIKIIKKH